jgi:hypothetical protein
MNKAKFRVDNVPNPNFKRGSKLMLANDLKESKW